MTFRKRRFVQHPIAVAVGMGIGSVALAAPLTFMQIPPGAAAREPAPNVILSLDDSGSMGWDANGCQTNEFLSGTYGNIVDPSRPANAPPCPPLGSTQSRMADLRAALRATFGNPTTRDEGILRDGRIRLAWQALDDGNATFQNNLNRPAGQQNDQDLITPGQPNSLRPFSGAHRVAFENFIRSLRPTSLRGTSLHRLMSNVDTYMRTPVGVNNPFANVPGTDATALACRRTFHIVMTDGAWNLPELAATQAGNEDGRFGWAFPNGVVYTDNAQTNVYKDQWGGVNGTLADWALRQWATDYRTDLANDVRPLWRVVQRNADGTVQRNADGNEIPINETVGGVSLEPFWNPKNNPKTWQGVTTYTIGFSRSAITWAGGPVWDTVTNNNFGAGYATKVANTTQWLDLFAAGQDVNRGSDLWHAALNGRGRFYPTSTAADLRNAFEEILSDILSATARPLVSIAANSSRLTKNGRTFLAGYNSDRWSGNVSAYAIDNETGLPARTPVWQAATELANLTDAQVNSSRLILTHDGTHGRSFRWGNLTTAQQDLIRGTDSNTVGQNRVNYLRGDRSLEEPNGAFRIRDSRLGAVVNSNLWYVGKPTPFSTEYTGHRSFRSTYANRVPMVYVGSSDGMLHGFDANTGRERLAYVPLGVYDKLRSYTSPTYSHQYMVDGSPFTGDANLGASGWRTVLVGSLGAGGRGYFVLDVTDPGSFSDPGTGTSSQVIMDRTGVVDADIGHIFATPTLDNETSSKAQQIVKLNNGRWAVIMGNGYNSANERPVLLIQYLDGSRGLKKIIADSRTAQTNGLSAPAVFDVDVNGTADVVFAGDLNGNLWKFNLVSTDDSNWGVSGWNGTGGTCQNSTSCQPLFVAKTSGGTVRPITAAPYLMIHPQGGLQVIFGTGRDLTASDRNTTNPTETLFSVWDMSTYSIVNSALTANETNPIPENGGRAALVSQTATGSSGRLTRTSNNEVKYSREGATKRGWYLDLPVQKQRILLAPRFFDGPNILVSMLVPKAAIEGETCDLSSAKDTNYLGFFNGISGAPPKTSVFGEVLDPSGNATIIENGSGEFITLTDSKNRRTTAINTDYFCTENCDNAGGGPGDGGSGLTTCTGADSRRNGDVCTCVGPDCECTGPGCRPLGGCGTAFGNILDVCPAGTFGARTDWRELR